MKSSVGDKNRGKIIAAEENFGKTRSDKVVPEPLTHCEGKENLLGKDSVHATSLRQLKSSLKRANQRALQLRMAEVESRMRSLPF